MIHEFWITTVIGLIILVAVPVAGNATVSVRLSSFTNGVGRDWDGNCCEFYNILCHCDHVFRFCFDRPDAKLDLFSPCVYGWLITDEFQNSKIITFNQHHIGGIPNPIRLPIPDYTEHGIQIKVVVQDDDTGHSRNDLVDKFQIQWEGAPAPWYGEPIEDTHIFYGLRTRTTKTTFVMHIAAQCDPEYYGPTCAVYCKKRDDYDERTGICKGAIPQSVPRISGRVAHISPNTAASTKQEKGISGLVIGLICGIFLAVLTVIIAVALVYRHRRNRKVPQPTTVVASFDNVTYGETSVPATVVIGGTGPQNPAPTQYANVVFNAPDVTDDAMIYAEPDMLGATGVIYDNPRPLKPPAYDQPPRSGSPPPEYTFKEDVDDIDDFYAVPPLPVKTKK